MNIRLIALNAAGGAQVVVSATRWCRRIEVIEDEATTPQGLIFNSPDDGFAQLYQVGPGTEALIFDNSMSQGRGQGPIYGQPVQNSSGAPQFIAATTLFKATSATATTTKIRFREVD